MESGKVDYDEIVRKQSEMVQKKGNIKRKSLIHKDKQYFDSTELSKVFNPNKQDKKEGK